MVNSVAGFVQDDWKVSPRLTLNLGVRYDIFLAPTFPDGRVSNFLLDYTRTGASGRLPQIRPQNGSDCGCEQNYHNFAPRTGLRRWVPVDRSVPVGRRYTASSRSTR